MSPSSSIRSNSWPEEKDHGERRTGRLALGVDRSDHVAMCVVNRLPVLALRLLLRIGHADRPVAGVVRGVPADAVGVAERKLVARRVERGRGHVAQRVDRFCKLNTYYRPDPKVPDAVGVAERKLVPGRVERGRGDVAQRIDRFCKLNTYYRPDPKVPCYRPDPKVPLFVAKRATA